MRAAAGRMRPCAGPKVEVEVERQSPFAISMPCLGTTMYCTLEALRYAGANHGTRALDWLIGS